MDFATRLAALRARFVESLPARRAALHAGIDLMASDPARARHELELLLHHIVGTAGVHGLVRLSSAADATLHVLNGPEADQVAKSPELAELEAAIDAL